MKLAAYGLVLGAAFGAGAAVGAAIGPDPRRRAGSGGDRTRRRHDSHGLTRWRPTIADGHRFEVDLQIDGMTCASCAARIEKRLNRLDGVEATVNFATEEAKVRAPSPVDVDDLVAAVEAAGYRAHVPRPVAAEPADEGAHDHGVNDARRRLIVSAVLSLPVIALGMFPFLQFDNWQWLSLTLAAPVVTWGAWPFHRAAWVNLRHAAATMDTLVSVGVLAAFGWSLYALFLGDAGEPGLRHGFSLIADRDMASSQIFLEVAAGVTTFILAGRYLETRAKRNAGAALRALLELGAKDVAVLRDGAEQRIGIDDLVVGDRFVVRPGEKVATDGVVEDGTSAIDASLLTGEPVPVEVGPGDSVTGGTVNAGGRLVVRAVRGRSRHQARPDRPPRPRRPGRQGTGAAPRRPRRRRVRPGGDRRRRRHARVLARHRRVAVRRLHRRGRRC